jgi:pimeloyl-ACP methyl ester carboxylesterase
MAVAASETGHETTVRVGGLDLFVRERGAGDPLLMINGLGANVDMWGPAEERLSTVARTVTFDAPGTGRSTTPVWPQTIAGSAGVAEALLDELEYDRVDVLGFSLGGLVAQELAHRAPQRVRRLALAGTAVGWGSMPPTLPALALMSMPARYYSRTLSEQTNWLLSPADRALLRRFTPLTDARLRHPPSLLGYAGQFWAAATWSSLRWLSSLRVPTLVLHGELDDLVPPANGVQLARLLPQARLHVLPDEGHFIAFDPSSRALPLLQDFYAGPTLEASSAWASGTEVDDDATVDAAFEASPGAQPYRALSAAFRRLLGNGPPDDGANGR